MRDGFQCKGKGLWGNFVISTAQHLDFPFELPLVSCLYHALPSDHIVPMVGTERILDWVYKDLQGVRLHKLQFTAWYLWALTA